MQSKHLLVALVCLPLLAGGVYFLAQDNAADVEYDNWGQADDGQGPADADSGVLTGDTPKDENADSNGNDERSQLDETEIANGQSAPVPRPPVVIHGRVVNRFRAAVAGARVQLTLQKAGSRGRRGQVRNKEPLVTKQDGSFAFEAQGYPNLLVQLEVTHDEYALGLHQDTFQGLDTDGDVDLGEIEVVIGGTLAGAITDMAGVVLPGAEARLLPQDGRLRNLRTRSKVFPNVKANNSGLFRMEHIPPGQYRVMGVAPHRQRRYTDVITIPDAEEVVLDPLQLGPGFQLTGRVFKPEGGPAPGAEVSLLFSRGWGRAQRTRTDDEGHFAYDHLAKGTYALTVRAKGYLQHRQNSIQVENAPELNITLVNGLRISGTILDSVSNQPVTAYAARVRRVGSLVDPKVASLQAMYADLRRTYDTKRRRMNGRQRRQMEVKLRTMREKLRENGVSSGWDRGRQRPRNRNNSNPWQNMPRDAGKPEARPGGKFSFQGLEEGIYVVDFSASTYQRIRSERIELRRGGMTPYLTLYMERGLLLAGKILDKQSGEPIANARVNLMIVLEPQPPGGNGRPNPWREMRKRFQGPGPQRGISFLNTRTDKKGEYRLQQAGPGNYQLIARAEGYARGFTEPFDLTSNVEDQQLMLGRLGVVHGRVYAIPADKVEEARVIVSDLRRHKTVKVEPDMTYRVENLQPGNYMVRAFFGSFDAYRRSSMRRFHAAGSDPFQIKPDIQIKEGSDVDFDVRIDQDPVGDFKGQILVNGFGSGARGFHIYLQEINPMGEGMPRGTGFGRWRPNRASTRVDQRGHYHLKDVMAGRYTMSIRASGRRAPEVYRQVVYIREDQHSNQTPIALMLGTFAGSVLPQGVSSDNAKAQKRIWGNVQLLPGISEMPKDWREFRRNNPIHGQQVRRGKFKFENLPLGEYLMILRVNGYGPRIQPVFVDGSPIAQDYQTGKRRRPKKKSKKKPKPKPKGASAKKPKGGSAKKPKGKQGR